ncbi:MAG TPA: response regulator [Bryobacteraceae bacterium]|nr:response regulator [Bryobacteraceae bacterium]
MTVLIVDDTHSCGETLAVALAANPDLDVRTVASAQEALLLAETIPLAAVVTDLHMPRIDGFELIRRLRAEPKFDTVPIIVISGDSDADTPARLKSLGADAFFSKPFSPAAVRHTLEHILYAK